jgi:hypothetical protein
MCKSKLSYHNWHTVIKITGATFRATVLLILLLQAMTAVQTTLLMRSGDVEMNPGPGLYPGGWLILKINTIKLMLFSLSLSFRPGL